MSEVDAGVHFPNTSQGVAGDRSTGRVKWFNNKSGYGFVTVTSSEKEGPDIFVHHSSIKVDKEQYRYLVQGEYVEFTLSEVSGKEHTWQAADVSGINGGSLMCETRLESRSSKDVSSRSRETTSDQVTSPTKSRVRSHGRGPREGEEWMLIRRRVSRGEQTQSVRTRPPRTD